jgi:hypothetical protein
LHAAVFVSDNNSPFDRFAGAVHDWRRAYRDWLGLYLDLRGSWISAHVGAGL